jgi:outer membrane receptor protein involved in Fe transport
MLVSTSHFARCDAQLPTQSRLAAGWRVAPLAVAALCAAGISSRAAAQVNAQVTAQITAQATPQTNAQVTDVGKVVIIGNSPLGVTGIPADLFPGNVQTVPIGPDARSGSNNVSELLARTAGSVNLNDTQGTPFQVDLNYRGFTASPILGTPQGLSVYLDGIRMNEPFGDVVSWDLVPEVALKGITLIPGTNPVFGMNTLGGAVAMTTKTGFDFDGTAIDLGTGSHSRASVEAEYGHHSGTDAVYLATTAYYDKGWAVDNPSRSGQVFGSLSHHDGADKIDLTLHLANGFFAGNQLVPVSRLADPAQGYSRPDSTTTRAATLNLRGSHQLSAQDQWEGNVYFRHIARDILNSNIDDPVTPGLPDQAAFCQSTYGEYCASNVLSSYTQKIYGLNLEYASQKPLWGHRNYLAAGLNAESGSTRFSQAGQDALVGADDALVGVDAYTPQAAITATSRRAGVYATDTWVATSRASATASLRFDTARVALSGNSIDNNGDSVSVDGTHTYRRLNPAFGGTYVLTPAATLFANYAEGLRAPSAIELACADPEHPCAGVPNAFSADPPLDAVVVHSLELGARGKWSDDDQWRVSSFVSQLSHDILFNQSSLTTGYFSNVGRTRRRGLEASLTGQRGRWDYAVSGTALQATYESSFLVANPDNADPSVPVHPGDRLPGIPQFIGKVRLGYAFGSGTHVQVETLTQSFQYSRGNENNLPGDGRVPGFTVVKLSASHQINDTFELYGGVTNLFDRTYANFGMLGNNGFVGPDGTSENFWGVGTPREWYAGLRMRF